MTKSKTPDYTENKGIFKVGTLEISINCPSYKRPKVETLDYLPYCRVWIAEKELPEYKANNHSDSNIITVPDKVQGNVARIRNYILDQEFKAGRDVVIIIDDDMKKCCLWKDNISHDIQPEEFPLFVYKYSIMARDMGVHYWGMNINQDKQVYREYTPFSTTSFIGAPFCAFVDDNHLRFDEDIPLKEDYDMTLQQLNKERKVLRVNHAYYIVRQAKQSGGCAQMRNYKKEKQQLEALQSKWGSDIVRIDNADRSHNLKKEKSANRMDFNPIIKVPIKGV